MPRHESSTPTPKAIADAIDVILLADCVVLHTIANMVDDYPAEGDLRHHLAEYSDRLRNDD